MQLKGNDRNLEDKHIIQYDQIKRKAFLPVMSQYMGDILTAIFNSFMRACARMSFSDVGFHPGICVDFLIGVDGN